MNPVFQTVFRMFLKDKDKIVNALELPYSSAKLEATNHLIKVINRNAFGFRKFENLKKNSYHFEHRKGENQLIPLLNYKSHKITFNNHQ